jgi:hypothetical protein
MNNMLVAFTVVVAIFAANANAQTIKLGETSVLGGADDGNAGLLLAQGPYALSQAATIQSLSFYVTTAAGQLRLGIYDSGPNYNCKGGTLKAQTNPFTPVRNSWNTANVITQVQLPVGGYCLAYEPSSSSLGFRGGITSGVNEVHYSKAFGPLPNTFSTNPAGDNFHWSFSATLAVGSPLPPTLSLSLTPSNPTIPNSSPGGTVVAQINATWSDGSPFTGILGFGTPYFSDNGTFAISGNNLIIDPNGPGVGPFGNTIQNVTVVATQ